jgi:hypothetical protein
MTSGRTIVYCADPVLNGRISQAVRALCRGKKQVRGLRSSKKVQLTPYVVNLIIGKSVEAAAHAASGLIPDATAKRGAPPDNARILLAYDVVQACKAAGLSPGLRYVHPPSFAVELFVTVASLIWPSSRNGYWNPRKTFTRMRGAEIIGN